MEKAILDFGMIAPGDRVAVAVSGGKDSLALMRLMRGPLVHVTQDFSLEFIHIDTGFPGHDSLPIRDYAASCGVDLHVVKTDIYEQSAGKKKKVCWLCSRRRRKALLETAHSLGCGKVALGHHRDDAVETLLMNEFFNAEISCMMPNQPLFRGEFHLIRPLYYVREANIVKLARELGLPAPAARCPAEDVSKREYIRRLLDTLEQERPVVRDHIFNAQFRVLDEYLPKLPEGGGPPPIPPRVFKKRKFAARAEEGELSPGEKDREA